jgi:hypothetical protein
MYEVEDGFSFDADDYYKTSLHYFPDHTLAQRLVGEISGYAGSNHPLSAHCDYYYDNPLTEEEKIDQIKGYMDYGYPYISDEVALKVINFLDNKGTWEEFERSIEFDEL